MKIISLGAGVQSSTMALMSAVGELEMVDAAIFADTQGEPESVYKWLDRIRELLPFPVHAVTRGNLYRESLEIRRSKKSGNLYQKAQVPAFVKKPNGKVGMLNRKCTVEYKINVIKRKIQQVRQKRRVEQWIGITTDEAHRMKDARVQYIQNRWPLIEKEMSRNDCIQWLEAQGFRDVPRSACTFCPFHSNSEWQRLKMEEPEGFAEAVAYEHDLQEAQRNQEALVGIPYLHPSAQPLNEINFLSDPHQLDLFGHECEGMCGV